MSRLEELATAFEAASEAQGDGINGCIAVNLRPEAWADVAKYLRAMQTLADQAKQPFVD